MRFTTSRKYRKDIDGLRAIAVLSVIIFHFGYLPNGFLGVDIFFVISGFLITGILYHEVVEKRFSIFNFYLRRIRRIIPLVSLMCLISLGLGVLTMLPDDLENMAQSVIATNFFSNNILAVLTTKNYWDVVNEFKPLMHTWSLGIEEQYYLFYPFIFLLFGKARINWILPVITICTIISLILFFSPFEQFNKFYLLQFRFYELSIGGISAILLNRRLIHHKFSLLCVIALLALLCFDLSFISDEVLLFLTVLISCIILSTGNEKNKWSSIILENKIMVGIGKISFSLYMWHQILLAYTRYFILEELSTISLFIVFIFTVILSIITYYCVEQPFRDWKKIGNRTLFLVLGTVFFLTTSFSFYLYVNAGVIKDIPELDIEKHNVERNMHAKYNDQVYNLDKEFGQNKKTRILVIGNSFARDWVNVLMQTKNSKNIEISYIYDFKNNDSLKNRIQQANYIFYASDVEEELNLDIDEIRDKFWYVGIKNFGVNNGIFYNNRNKDYCNQRTLMQEGYLMRNKKLKKKWKNQYLDLIAMVIDDQNKVPVFTPDCKFISQDGRHFTKAGAKYFAELLETKRISF